MVLVLRIPPQEALQTFALARGYDIERQNYINSIISHEINFDLREQVMQNSRWNSNRLETENTDDNNPEAIPSPEILTQEISRQPYHRRDRDRQHLERYQNNLFASQNGVRQGRGGGRNRQNPNRFDDDRSRHRPNRNLTWRNPNY